MRSKVSAALAGIGYHLLRRAAEEEGEEGDGDTSQREIFISWALFIMIALLIIALFTSYILQQRRVEAVHETVISIFGGMTVGLILRVSNGTSIQNLVTFDYQIFFNLLLPPIILNSGYELHQANFFRNIGTILTFAFAGTFISAIVLGVILWLYTRINIDGFEDPKPTFVDAISVGATLSATDPVTILAIFNTYKVDPKLYTIIFGESILNDAIAIVLFETAQRYKKGAEGGTLGFISLIEGIGIFLAVFFGSLAIGVIIGIATALGLKYTYVRRFPKIESCIVVLIAYSSYFFANGLHMSVGICVARWAAVFPLSTAINWFIRYRARRKGREAADELPYSYQAMLFWAGLRGAVGVALAAGIEGTNSWALKATVLVVVVLTVIIFGGTTARMLEILGIQTGVVEEIDSDDEFDIEAVSGNSFYKHSGTGIGNVTKRGNGQIPLNGLTPRAERGLYASGNSSPRPSSLNRKNSARSGTNESEQELLRPEDFSDVDSDTSDLPPPAKRSSQTKARQDGASEAADVPYPTSGRNETPHITASGAISQLLHGTTEDHAAWFKQLDEGFIKPKLLLDGGKGGHGGPSGSGS
ncbi:hypothetical protein OIDMADRAFT_189482 [Oidiodendron maius Zn]|uniref:Sodium/hydrogen exchanger n=1 Tax=Oidiodendron maius (strain Zn) TaxID=913774 RepID=A0A0C3HS70_OIDMZ|nr:hypothetical protein OIDMADRAFT_189482 [Oidiodendron maius Zn]